MSHQKLEDLVNFTGTATDGQILKYTASSTSWGPADESGGGGGGSSDTPYFEMWDLGSADSNSGTSGAMPLYVPSSAKILNNTIDTSRLALVTDSSWSSLGLTFNAAFNDSYMFKRSSTGLYYIEIDYTVKLDNSSDIGDALVVRVNDVGDNIAGSGAPSKNGFLAGSETTFDAKVVSFDTYTRFTHGSTHQNSPYHAQYGYANVQYPGTTNAAYEAYDAGTYMHFKAGWTFGVNPSNSNQSNAICPSLQSIVDSTMTGWPSNAYDSLQFNYKASGTIYNQPTIMHRKVRVVQLA